MTHAELKTALVALTGRRDLGVNATLWLNAAQRQLDALTATVSGNGRWQVDLAENAWQIVLTNCRDVKSVWVTSTDGRFLLKKKTIEWLRSYYGYEFGSDDVDSNVPIYWAVNLAIDQTDPVDAYAHDADDLVVTPLDKKVLVFMPPADGVYTMTVFADFFTPNLVEEADETRWTGTWSSLLLFTAAHLAAQAIGDREESDRWAIMAAPLLQDVKNMQAEEGSPFSLVEAPIPEG